MRRAQAISAAISEELLSFDVTARGRAPEHHASAAMAAPLMG
jgi:hypothetical protein